MNRYLLSLVFGVAWFSAAAEAQTGFPPTHRAWEFTVFGGGSLIHGEQFETPVIGSSQETTRTVGMHFGVGPQLGVRIAENRWNHWGASLEYSFSNQPLSFTNVSPDLYSIAFGHSVHRWVYDVLYYPLDRSKRLRPYAFAGGGVSLFHINEASKAEAASTLGLTLTDSWKFAFSWGGGVKYLALDHVAFCLQLSDRITGVPDYGFPRSIEFAGGEFRPGFEPTGYLNNWLLSLGFAYQWGER
jgi:opacity protein-like surface antigen